MKQPRTKFTVMGELSAIDRKMEKRAEGFMSDKAPAVPLVELQMRKARLRHELKMFDMRKADGDESKSIKEFWKRQSEEERKRQKAAREAERRRIEQAKKELKKDKVMQAEAAAELSVEELEEILAKKRGEK